MNPNDVFGKVCVCVIRGVVNPNVGLCKVRVMIVTW